MGGMVLEVLGVESTSVGGPPTPLPHSIVPLVSSAVCRVLAMHVWWPPSPVQPLYEAPLLHTALVLNPEYSWVSARPCLPRPPNTPFGETRERLNG